MKQQQPCALSRSVVTAKRSETDEKNFLFFFFFSVSFRLYCKYAQITKTELNFDYKPSVFLSFSKLKTMSCGFPRNFTRQCLKTDNFPLIKYGFLYQISVFSKFLPTHMWRHTFSIASTRTCRRFGSVRNELLNC